MLFILWPWLFSAGKKSLVQYYYIFLILWAFFDVAAVGDFHLISSKVKHLDPKELEKTFLLQNNEVLLQCNTEQTSLAMILCFSQLPPPLI